MKRDKLLSCLIGTALAFLIGCSGVLCLVTGFSVEQVNIGAVLLWSGVASVAFSACFTWKLGLVPMCALSLAGGYLWRQGTLAYSAEALINKLSVLYSMGYKWPVIAWSGRELEGVDLTPALCAISLLTVLIVSWTVCRRKPAFLAVLMSMLPVAACVVVTDTVPRAIWLFGYLFGISVLLISQLLRRRSARDGNRLTAMVLAPVVLVLGVLFLLLPQEGYGKDSMGTMGDAVSDWVEQVLTSNQGPAYLNVSGGAMNLTNVGSRKESDAVVMEVTADDALTLYLRSYSYDTYYANYWTNGGNDSALGFPDHYAMVQTGQVQISTTYVHSKLYIPYYCSQMVDKPLDRGQENWAKEKVYTYNLQSMPSDIEAYEYPLTPMTEFTALPEDTEEWAKEMLLQITDEKESAIRIAQAVGSYVSGCAEYDLNARRMPTRFDDFAYWFLTEADEGYCVHFATAATVLLRAAGIPARYVTGYLVQTQPGETVAVKGKNAHAWVEYWVKGVGWLVLEPTPARQLAQISQADPAPVTQATEETEETVETAEAMATTEDRQEQTKPTVNEQKKPTDKPKETVSTGKTALWVVGSVLTALLATLTQWRLRLWLRLRRRKHGRMNSRVVAAWREAVFLARLLGEKPDKGLFSLAQKAKFSQYVLDEESLGLFEKYIDRATEKLREKPFLLRLVYRLIFAAY